MKFVIGALILFGLLIFFNIFSKNNNNYTVNNSNINPVRTLMSSTFISQASRAVVKAYDCYRSLPSQAQSFNDKTMEEARKYYAEGYKYLNLDPNNKFKDESIAMAYFDKAIAYSNLLMENGRAAGSRSCGS